MSDMKPVSLEDLLRAPESGRARTPTAPLPPAADLTPVRFFTKDGLTQVAALLKTIRTDKTLHREEVEDLLEDPQFAKPLPGTYAIDRAKPFATKLDLCEYFTSVFDNTFLETHRKDAGLWTWLALAYYQQFVKTKGSNVVGIATDARWIFDPDVYRLSRRHFVAGTLDLYRSAGVDDEKVKEVIFSGPVMEMSRFVDVLTYVPDCARNPAFLQAAVELYYDGTARTKVRRAAFDKNKPSSVWQFIRVFQQLKQTRDFFDKVDAQELLNLLPHEFHTLILCVA